MQMIIYVVNININIAILWGYKKKRHCKKKCKKNANSSIDPSIDTAFVAFFCFFPPNRRHVDIYELIEFTERSIQRPYRN